MTAGEAGGNELVGQVLGGRYRVTAPIGRGGMGVVARAVDELLGREVAVKILRVYTDASGPELADLRARMQREAQAAARIRHGGVVTVHDVTEDQGLPVIVMELVDGPSLDDVLAERGSLEPREAAAIGAKLMDALGAAHRAGVLHRDVKPANVLLERGGRVVLTDFGIATMEASDEDAMTRLTQSGQIIGSIDYLPPERAQGREPGPASDIWSLGMTLYAAVEGASPFRRTSVWSTMTAIVNEPLPEPRRAGPLTPVLRALMAKEPEHRPSAEQARRMLEEVAAGGTPDPAPAPTAAVSPLPPPGFGAAPLPQAAPQPFPQPSPPSFPQPAAQPFPQPSPPSFPQPAAQPFPHPSPHPFPQPPPTGYGPPPGVPAPDPAPGRSRGRGRVVIAAAAAAVLAGGGVTYALMDGNGSTNVANAAPAVSTSSAGKASPSRSARGKPSATPSQHPSRTPAARPSATPHASPSASAKPSAVSKSCTGWSHQDPHPGTYGYLSGSYHLQTGPYESCPSVTLAKTGTKLWYHCSVVNAYGHTWTYVRVEGTKTAGWMSNDNLTRQTGPSTRC
ncbi:serine/threonine-protein kinase [Streptomyces sp. NPDC049577]|uniref:serine/threonine-protein kinase n=1 Tax=Streptomyces sp. NPDC049577 TaxID=3155153 RepID=UPI00341D24DA